MSDSCPGTTVKDFETPKPKRRWFRLTSYRFLIGLLVAQVLLLLAERYSLFGLGQGSGWKVLLVMGPVGLAVLSGLFRFGMSLNSNRRFQFKLRTLAVSMLLIGVGFGWLGQKVHQARRHREAIRAAGAWRVRFDYEMLGHDLGDMVSARPTFGTRPGDVELEQLQGLVDLEYLDLDGTKVTDAGLEHLKGLTGLEVLDISHTRVTEVGLEHLKGLTKLEVLYMCCLYRSDRSTRISDADIQELQEALPNCRIVGP